MSALWVLALGASIGYLAYKRQILADRLDLAVKEWEGSGAEPAAPPDGASFSEIKQAWKYTADTRNRDFNERLPQSDRAALLAAEDQRKKEVQQFDGPPQPPEIEGIYLEF